MKTIIFMRHGKAADYYEYDTDFERPLVGRGKAEVRAAAEKLKAAGIAPNLIIASPAFRTSVTARIVAEVMGIVPEKIEYESSLYMGSENDYLAVINTAKADIILIAGHNPSTGNLAMHFGRGKIVGFPTSSMAAFGFEGVSVSKSSTPELLYFDLRK